MEPMEIVAGYLARFYKDECNDITAAKNAVWAAVEERRQQWKVRCAFRRIMDAAFPEGTLTRLVVENAKRNVWSDEEAREFIRQVYEDTYLDNAVDYDELAREQEELFGKKQ